MAGLCIETKLRPCYVILNKNKKKKALFHCWSYISNVVPPSIMVGGHPGGTVSYTLGVVEYEDGSIDQVDPISVQFIPGAFKDYAFDDEKGE